MRLLRLAVETKRWDLAAHTIVLAAVRHPKGACPINLLESPVA